MLEAVDILRLYVSKPDIIKKSVYTFDLESEEGAQSFLNLVPVLDIDILKQAFEHIFPQYDTTNLDLKRARAEIRGYILNMLKSFEVSLGD